MAAEGRTASEPAVVSQDSVVEGTPPFWENELVAFQVLLVAAILFLWKIYPGLLLGPALVLAIDALVLLARGLSYARGRVIRTVELNPTQVIFIFGTRRLGLDWERFRSGDAVVGPDALIGRNTFGFVVRGPMGSFSNRWSGGEEIRVTLRQANAILHHPRCPPLNLSHRAERALERRHTSA